MKTKYQFSFLVVAAVLVSVISCRSSKSTNEPVIISGKRPSTSTSSNSATTHLPPGQAKKINGDKSAKAYAPGQQKKKNNGKKKKG